MAQKSESTTTSKGVRITTVVGSNWNKTQCRALHRYSVHAAELICTKAGTQIEVHIGTNKTRCGSRRLGVHYQQGNIHYLGINNISIRSGGQSYNPRGLETLCHEMIHAEQYSTGRLKRGSSVMRYGAYQSTYIFSGEWNGSEGPRSYVDAVIPRPRNPSYKTYRNFGWEQEAFEMQAIFGSKVLHAIDAEDRGFPVVYTAPVEAPVEAPVANPIKVTGIKTFGCSCGKSFKSRQGRYNCIKKNGCCKTN